MRLDKFLTVTGCCSRSEAKRVVRGGGVTVNGVPARSSDMKVSELTDRIAFCGKTVVYQQFRYIMLNKPSGVVSATEDGKDPTVLDLLPSDMRKTGLFPCGRLDKNTLGLMLITDDGALGHRLLSPKHHVSKEYRFCSKFPVSEDDVQRMEEGLTLEDGYVTLPSKVLLDEDGKSGTIILNEGKYHQIKRMLEAVHNQITYLERIRFGSLSLDPKLQRGDWRELTRDEMESLVADACLTNDRNGESS